MTGGCRHRFLEVEGRAISVAEHLPAAARGEGSVPAREHPWLVLVPAFAEEQKHSLRSLVELGDRLASSGVGVLRLDPSGVGNSAGTYWEACCADWHREVAVAGRWLRERHAVSALIAGGLRFGALTALAAAAEEPAFDAALLLVPVASGRLYCRELRRKNLLRDQLQGSVRSAESAAAAAPDPELLEVQGFPVPERLLDGIESMDGGALLRDFHGPVYLLDTDDRSGQRNAAWLSEIQGLESIVELRPLRRFWYYEVVEAGDHLAAGVEELFARRPPAARNVSPAPVPTTTTSCEVPARSSPGAPGAAEGWAERHHTLEVGGESLWTVMHFPPAGRALGVGALLLDGGAGSGCGPHRLLVDIARDLASLGFHVLRHASRGRGESGGQICERRQSLEELLSLTVEDALACADHLERRHGCDELLLLGICEGAELAIVLAGELPTTRQLVAWSPFDSFSDGEGTAQTKRRATFIGRYLRRLVDPLTWSRLLRGEIDRRGVLAALGLGGSRPMAAAAGGDSLSRPARRYQSTRGRTPSLRWVERLLFVYAADDPLTEPARQHYLGLWPGGTPEPDEVMLPGTDHGFYSLSARFQLLEATRKWISAGLSARSSAPNERISEPLR